jgi:ribosomal protein L3
MRRDSAWLGFGLYTVAPLAALGLLASCAKPVVVADTSSVTPAAPTPKIVPVAIAHVDGCTVWRIEDYPYTDKQYSQTVWTTTCPAAARAETDVKYYVGVKPAVQHTRQIETVTTP